MKKIVLILISAVSLFAGQKQELSLQALLDVVVETGSFLEMDLSHSPVSMNIISKEDIELASSTRLSELLEIHVPGFYTLYNKWVGEVWAQRGVASDINNKFILLVNGRKMNVESRDGTIASMYAYIGEDVERVEVIRGPAGLVYGSGAMAGVVNIVTKTNLEDGFVSAHRNDGYFAPDDQETGISILAGYEFENELSITASANYRESNGIGWDNSKVMGHASWNTPQWVDVYPKNGTKSTAAYHEMPGDYAFSLGANWKGFNFYARHEHYDFRAAGFFMDDPYPAVEAGWEGDMWDYFNNGGGDWADTSDQYYSFYSQASAWGENRRGYRTNNSMFDLSHDFEFDNGNKIKSFVNYNIFDQVVYYQDMARYTHEYTGSGKAEEFGETRLTLNSMFLLGQFEGLQLATGAEIRFNNVGENLDGVNSSGESETKSVFETAETKNIAFFSEGSFEITDDLTLHGGVRVDKHTNTDWIPSPKLSLIYAFPDEKHFIKLVGQSSSNNPNADQSGYTQYSTDDNGNPYDEAHFAEPSRLPTAESDILPAITREQLESLRPEKSYSGEVIVLNKLDFGIELENSLGVNMYKDAFIWEQSQYRNLNGGTYKTFQWEGSIKWTDPDDERWSVGVNHSFSRVIATDFKDEETLFTTPAFDQDTTDNWYVNNGTAESPEYVPVSNGSLDTGYVNSVKNNVTIDNESFLNMPMQITKVIASYKPIDDLTLYMDHQIFWNFLGGRKDLYENQTSYSSDIWYEKNDINTFNAEYSPVIKSHFAIRYQATDELSVTLGVKDAFSNIESSFESFRRNTLRHQVMISHGDQDLYTSDAQKYYLKIRSTF